MYTNISSLITRSVSHCHQTLSEYVDAVYTPEGYDDVITAGQDVGGAAGESTLVFFTPAHVIAECY